MEILKREVSNWLGVGAWLVAIILVIYASRISADELRAPALAKELRMFTLEKIVAKYQGPGMMCIRFTWEEPTK